MGGLAGDDLNIKEIREELKSILQGKTIDAILPPFVYVIINGLFGLCIAAGSALAASLVLVALRLKSKKNWKYAFAGFMGVVIAVGFAILSGSAANYYLPKLFTSIGLIVITVVSLILKKPLAAWLSHLSRGWELEWFWRPDIRPAYTEVTLFWLGLFMMRGALQFVLLVADNVAGLFLLNTLLGLPVTISVLVLSYIYGVWRLKKLGGPGIDEYRQGAPRPWKGQTRGF